MGGITKDCDTAPDQTHPQSSHATGSHLSVAELVRSFVAAYTSRVVLWENSSEEAFLIHILTIERGDGSAMMESGPPIYPNRCNVDAFVRLRATDLVYIYRVQFLHLMTRFSPCGIGGQPVTRSESSEVHCTIQTWEFCHNERAMRRSRVVPPSNRSAQWRQGGVDRGMSMTSRGGWI